MFFTLTITLLLILLFSFLSLTSTNPVHAILFLVGIFFGVSIALLLLGIDFLAVAFVLVYIGAVAVLFLFVAMMLNLKTISGTRTPIWGNLAAGLTVSYFLSIQFLKFFNADFFDLVLLNKNLTAIALSDGTFCFVGDTASSSYSSWFLTFQSQFSNAIYTGSTCYTYTSFLFFITMLILLVVMVGAIVLVMNQNVNLYRQNISLQTQTGKLKTTVKLQRAI